jgi:hypothetical protein
MDEHIAKIKAEKYESKVATEMGTQSNVSFPFVLGIASLDDIYSRSAVTKKMAIFGPICFVAHASQVLLDKMP